MGHEGPGPDPRAWVTERCDPTTVAHLLRVQELAGELAAHAGLSPEQQRQAALAGLLHDLGKSDVPTSVLDKRGRLDPAEEALVRLHPERGAAWLASLVDAAVVEAVRHHHERVDGRGYPDHVPACLLPIVTRLVPVADAYDAMTSIRPYRPPLSRDRAFEELRLAAGRQLDAELVEALIDLERSRTEPRAA